MTLSTTLRPVTQREHWFGTLLSRRIEPGSAGWYFLKDHLAVISLLFLCGIILAAIFAPYLTSYPDQGRGVPNAVEKFLPPSASHPLGTDQLGRDILARLLFGARTSLAFGLVVIVLAVLIGSALGALAGFFGGGWDELIMRVTDIFLAFPPLLLAIVVASVLERGLVTAILAITLTWWPWYTRIVRGQVLSMRERDYVKAARSIGVSNLTIIRRHLVPNIITPVLVQATLDLGAVILTAAGLSFLGLGSQPPTADWGVMISEGRVYIQSGFWWIATFAGLAIFLTTLAFNLLGDGVQTALNPHQRGGRS